MRRLVILLPLGLVMLAPTALAETRDVTIQGFAFDPESLEVAVGDTVRWTNLDSGSHTVTSDADGETPLEPDGRFDDTLSNGQTFEFVVAEAGTYDYYCRFHTSMRASFTATDADGTTAPTTSPTTTTSSPTVVVDDTTGPGDGDATGDGTPGPGLGLVVLAALAAALGTRRRA